MKAFTVVCLLMTLAMMSCQTKPTPLTDAQKTAIADSVKVVMQQVLESANKMDFRGALSYYSPDADARFMESGAIHASRDAMGDAYDQLGANLDMIKNQVDKWEVTVLGPDVAMVTLPIHITIKAKGRDAYDGQTVWSGVVQKRNGKWQVVQAHESWVNFGEAMAALAPP